MHDVNVSVNGSIRVVHTQDEHEDRRILLALVDIANTMSAALDQSLKDLALVVAAQDAVNAKLSTLIQQEEVIMADLTELTTAVENEVTVEQSAITLLAGLKAALDAAGTDPVALKALSDKIGTSSAALAAAVAANTPAAPAVP